MKILVIISILLLSFSCKNNEKKSVKKIVILKKSEKTTALKFTKSDTTEIKEVQNEVMSENDILFNGKLKRYFNLSDFDQVFGKSDSIKLVSEGDSCYTIFENNDGSFDSEDKYFYKDGSTFENSKDKVAVEEFRFIKNNFIVFKGIKLTADTTVNELAKIFPIATSNIGNMDVYNEGKLQVIQLLENKKNTSDGHINLFIKNNKLYFMHWWFPC